MTPTWTCGKCLVKYRVGEPARSDEVEFARCHCGLRFCSRLQSHLKLRLHVAEKDLPAGACVMEGAAE